MTHLDSIGSRYKSLRIIGEGGMATVYEAWDTSLERKVAVKVLPLKLSEDKSFITRFKREIKTLAMLQHPNIIPVFDSGTHEQALYYVMAFIDGKNLAEKILKYELNSQEFDNIAAGLLSALKYAHNEGVVHRDIKPENIYISNSGDAILADFGIALHQNVDETKLTSTGSFIGTVAYASPEQFDGKSLDQRSDIYSLGAVFFYMINGEPPYQGTITQIIKSQLGGSLGKFNEKSPILQKNPGLRDLIQSMLQFDPSKRPQTAAAVLEVMNLNHNSHIHPATKLPENDNNNQTAVMPAERDKASRIKPSSMKKFLLVAGVIAAIIMVFAALPSKPKKTHSTSTPLINSLAGTPALPNINLQDNQEFMLVPGKSFFGVENLVDGENKWSYQPNTRLYGWFEITFITEGKYEIEIINGYSYYSTTFGDLYQQNNRIIRVRVTYGENMDDNKIVTLDDGNRDFQSLGKFYGNRIRVTILETVPGTKWQDTAISEIRVHQH